MSSKDKEEVSSSATKIKLKLSTIKKQTSSDSTNKQQEAKHLEQTKLLEQQQQEKNMEYQK